MTPITIDAKLAAKLRQHASPAELCDEAGNAVGRFVPNGQLEEEWVPVTPEISEEELRRRLNSNEKRYTTAEVLAFLEKLDGQR